MTGHDSAGNELDPLQKLVAGNKRFAESGADHPRQSLTRRAELVSSQNPLAIVVSCSDSRVPPEIIFDQGVGDLFVIRSAGNVIDDVGLGSIEYAASALNTPLLFVLGHERCGAVAAAIQGGKTPGHISALVNAIKPALKRAKDQSGDKLGNCVQGNVAYVRDQLARSKPILADLVKSGKLKVVGGVYDLDTGLVQLVD